MEVCLPTTLSRHFSLRLKQCLLFLQATNDLEILQLLFSFLPLKDLLHFLSVSSHFTSFKRLQSMEIRILRAKLAHLQKPEEPLAWNPYRHLLLFKPATPQSKIQKINDRKYDFHQIIQKLRGYMGFNTSNKTKTPEQKILPRADNQEFSKFSQELSMEGRQLEQKLKGPAEGWADVSQAMQNDFILNQLKHVNNHSEKILPQTKRPINPHSYPKTSPLDLLEHYHARIDYERRKARRMLQEEVFLSVEQFRQLAQKDACSRQVFNNVYKEEKLRQQQMNVAKLRMSPSPDPKQFQLQAVEVKVKKQSIAGKVFSGIKELLEMEGRF